MCIAPEDGDVEGHFGTLPSSLEHKPSPASLALLFFLAHQDWTTISSPRPHLTSSTTAKRGKPGKGLESLLPHASSAQPLLNRATPLLRHGLNQAFLGHAVFLALLSPCMEPSFPNLFSALKLNSEAASGSGFKTNSGREA